MVGEQSWNGDSKQVGEATPGPLQGDSDPAGWPRGAEPSGPSCTLWYPQPNFRNTCQPNERWQDAISQAPRQDRREDISFVLKPEP